MAEQPMFVTPQPAPDAWSLYEEKRKREQDATAGTYLGAMWRQDSPVDGIVASVVGNQMTPDPTYVAYEPNEWAKLTDGIPEEFHKEFYSATSAAHAQFIRSRLQDKMSDVANLGDLGFVGNAGRVLFGFVEPSSLLAGVASGGIYGAVRGVSGVAGASRALGAARVAGSVDRAETAAEQLARAAVREGRAPALAAGVAGGAAFNATFEAVRQAVNFEDDNAMVLEAGLIGAAFSAPFVALRAHEMNKVARTADLERRVLGVVRKERDGIPLDGNDIDAVHEYRDTLQTVQDIETGKVRAEEQPLPQADGPAAVDPARALAIKSAAAASSTRRAEAFDKLEAQAARSKEGQLNELWSEGQMRRGEEAQRIAEILDTVNAGTKDAPNAMQMAFTKAALRKADAAEVQARKARRDAKAALKAQTAPVAVAPDATVPLAAPAAPAVAPPLAPEAVDPVGMQVSWGAADGGTYVGTVVGKYPNGRLKVDTMPDALPGESIKGRFKSVAREELDIDSEAALIEAVPEGFLPGSVGAAQIKTVTASPLSPDFDAPTAAGAVRGDIFSVLNASENPVIQELGHLMVKDAIGNSKSWAQKWTASEIKKHIWRAEGGRFHTAARDAYNEMVRIRRVGLLDQAAAREQFYENISRVARGDPSVLNANPDIASQLSKAASVMQDVYATLAVRAQKSGVEGAEGLVPNQHYVNRIWDQNKIRAAIARLDGVYGKGLGRAELDRAVAAAFPGWRNDVTKAHSFINAVRKLEFNHAMQDIQLLGRDMVVLRKELNKFLSGDEVDAMVDVMFVAKKTEPDAGNPGNLRFRLDIDENYSEMMKDGSEFRVSDLFENDSRIVLDKYINSMGGHIAMAEKGITSRAAFEAKIREAQEYHASNLQDSKSADKINEEIKLATDMYDYVTGRPMSTQSFNKFDRYAAAFRAYARSAVLGQLGIAAAFEVANAVGLAGMRAFFQQMPTVRGVIQAARSGRIANTEFATDIEVMWGFGREKAASYAREHEVSEFTYDRGLTRFENFSNKASHVVDVISGNSYFTAATRQYSASLMIQKHVNMSNGRMKLSESMRDRMVNNGLNRNEIDGVLTDLKQFSKVNQRGVVQELDWEGWQQQRQKTYDAYVTLVDREVREAIQDHDIGETFPFMHTTTGKIFSELKTFSLAAHSKQFLKGVHHRDSTTALTWSMSFLGQALAYTLQTAANFSHNQEELNKRLSLERIAAAATQRMSVLGITPMLAETGFFIGSGGGSLVRSGNTANTDNRNLFITPSMAVASKMLKGASVAVGAVNPLSSSVTTQSDMKALMSMVPGGNAWVMRNINDYVSSGFPKSEAKQ